MSLSNLSISGPNTDGMIKQRVQRVHSLSSHDIDEPSANRTTTRATMAQQPERKRGNAFVKGAKKVTKVTRNITRMGSQRSLQSALVGGGSGHFETMDSSTICGDSTVGGDSISRGSISKGSNHSLPTLEDRAIPAESLETVDRLIAKSKKEKRMKEQALAAERNREAARQQRQLKTKKKKKRSSIRAPAREFASLYAALDMVTPKNVLHQLDQIRNEPTVVTLDIEDLIISGNEQSEELLVQLSKFFFEGDRQWQTINFVDHVATADLKGWLRSKREAMDFFEDLFRDQPGILGFETLTFQAKMEADEGSPLGNLVALLHNIKRQRRVSSVKLFIDSEDEVDEEGLADVFEHDIVQEPLDVLVTFGWMPDPEGLLLLDAVLRMGRDLPAVETISSGLPSQSCHSVKSAITPLRRSTTDPKTGKSASTGALRQLRRNGTHQTTKGTPNATWATDFSEQDKDRRRGTLQQRRSFRGLPNNSGHGNIGGRQSRTNRRQSAVTPPPIGGRQRRNSRASLMPPTNSNVRKAAGRRPDNKSRGSRRNTALNLAVTPKQPKKKRVKCPKSPFEPSDSELDTSSASSVHSSDISDSDSFALDDSGGSVSIDETSFTNDTASDNGFGQGMKKSSSAGSKLNKLKGSSSEENIKSLQRSGSSKTMLSVNRRAREINSSNNMQNAPLAANRRQIFGRSASTSNIFSNKIGATASEHARSTSTANAFRERANERANKSAHNRISSREDTTNSVQPKRGASLVRSSSASKLLVAANKNDSIQQLLKANTNASAQSKSTRHGRRSIVKEVAVTEPSSLTRSSSASNLLGKMEWEGASESGDDSVLGTDQTHKRNEKDLMIVKPNAGAAKSLSRSTISKRLSFSSYSATSFETCSFDQPSIDCSGKTSNEEASSQKITDVVSKLSSGLSKFKSADTATLNEKNKGVAPNRKSLKVTKLAPAATPDPDENGSKAISSKRKQSQHRRKTGASTRGTRTSDKPTTSLKSALQGSKGGREQEKEKGVKAASERRRARRVPSEKSHPEDASGGGKRKSQMKAPRTSQLIARTKQKSEIVKEGKIAATRAGLPAPKYQNLVRSLSEGLLDSMDDSSAGTHTQDKPETKAAKAKATESESSLSSLHNSFNWNVPIQVDDSLLNGDESKKEDCDETKETGKNAEEGDTVEPSEGGESEVEEKDGDKQNDGRTEEADENQKEGQDDCHEATGAKDSDSESDSSSVAEASVSELAEFATSLELPVEPEEPAQAPTEVDNLARSETDFENDTEEEGLESPTSFLKVIEATKEKPVKLLEPEESLRVQNALTETINNKKMDALLGGNPGDPQAITA